MQSLSFASHSSTSLHNNSPAATVKGCLTEIVISDGSAIQPLQLLSILAQCNANQRWLTWLSPNRKINKRWLKSVGLQHTPVIHIDLCHQSQYELSIKILAAANSHMIIEWLGEVSEQERRAIKQHAIDSASQVILLRRECS
ncbi:MAG: hypothetical protein K6L60_06470 [Oceanobacter sp.]